MSVFLAYLFFSLLGRFLRVLSTFPPCFAAHFLLREKIKKYTPSLLCNLKPTVSCSLPSKVREPGHPRHSDAVLKGQHILRQCHVTLTIHRHCAETLFGIRGANIFACLHVTEAFCCGDVACRNVLKLPQAQL